MGATSVSEKSFSQTVIELAKLTGWEYYHTWSSIHSPAGYPDLVLVRPPELLIVELKSAKGKVTPKQLKWLELFRDCGVETHIWRPDDWDLIVKRLQR